MSSNDITLYGIPNCDSCRNARRWLDESELKYEFHDIRKDGLTVHKLSQWTDSAGWPAVLNKRSLTWRKVPEADRQNLNASKAIALMLEQPTLVKRPILDFKGKLIIGFSRAAYEAL